MNKNICRSKVVCGWSTREMCYALNDFNGTLKKYIDEGWKLYGEHKITIAINESKIVYAVSQSIVRDF